MASAAILPTAPVAANVGFVQSWELEGGDATIIMRGIFDANARLHEIGEDVTATRRLLEEDDGEEEEEDPP
jgi:hypothetical protein